MLKIKKAFSLIEALVAIFVLSMITLTYMNSSSVFIRQQADLINKDRLNQIADLILQDIMEYVKIENNLYGSIFADIQEIGTSDKTLEISNVTSLPKAGDIFIIADQPRRYTVASISGSMPNDVIIRTVENLPRTSSLPQSKLTFIAFKKNDLSCFDGLNLTNDSPPDSLENCAVLPEKVEDLFNHWKSIVEAEFGDDITVQTIDIDDQGLVKVTLGDANKNVTLAKKLINVFLIQL